MAKAEYRILTAAISIFKPRALAVETVEPSTIEEAMSTSEWRATAQAEYDALIHNSTWEQVPYHLIARSSGASGYSK
ncbi:protein NRT1/PTR FAMILY 6.2-like [Gossypium australe]|uniref:Protein NRT1/PTR FAMILY 6.2-like n=1 Tax=Gossypium australe TaxID=47621 RepID=A0A5B6VWS1_9ROSI|nr:protein NRT1/PTR FAMILY 6.2-like [Gossypium australe]